MTDKSSLDKVVKDHNEVLVTDTPADIERKKKEKLNAAYATNTEQLKLPF